MPLLSSITGLIHRNFLWLLLLAYCLAAIFPNFGLLIRKLELGQVHWFDGSRVVISLPLLMLSFLLFNAGLGIRARELLGILQKPLVLLIGFLGNMLVPILLIVSLGGLMHLWHSPDELQNLLVGLALIVSMPIAGSSTAWSQNANGNLSLSLGLVFLSTILSPFTTPVILHVFASLTIGDYSEDLDELAAQGTNAFMMITVVLPAVLGIFSHFILGEARTALVKPFLKLANFVVLLLLNYSNAATSLPQAFANPDVDYLLFILFATIVLCAAAFAAGWLISRLLKCNLGEQATLMFSLGMNNNGTGLVLAAATLSDHPAVLLPMIFYTLVQQVLAALIDRKFFNIESTEFQ
ncbi:MAG: bile acid:sodium symporter [Candidatus Obscuribacterales bacterium]